MDGDDLLPGSPPPSEELGAALPDVRGDLGRELLRASLKAQLFGTLQEPTRISRFALIERLAVGGMGEIYTAYDEQLDRKVAIKLVRPDRLDPDEARDGDGDAPAGTANTRLLREAQTLARLSHPNVVQVYEAGVCGDRVFLAMELIRGQSLRQWLAEHSELAEPQRWRAILSKFLAAGRGLAAAHAAGLVHRDVKPDNVLVGQDGRVCVADFGLARPMAAAGAATATSAETAAAPSTSKKSPKAASAGSGRIALGSGNGDDSNDSDDSYDSDDSDDAASSSDSAASSSDSDSTAATTATAATVELRHGAAAAPAAAAPASPPRRAAASPPRPVPPLADLRLVGRTSDLPAELQRLTRTGTVLGTPAYMSPEQLEGLPSDSHSDQFSFCVALYEALYGVLPFLADDLPSLRQRLERGPADAPPRRSRVPAWIGAVLQRGLARAPADRHASMDALLEALSSDPVRRRRALAISFLGSAALACALALWVMTRPEEFDPCAQAGAPVTRTWNPQQAERAAAAFAASGLRFAAAAWTPLRPRVDQYAAALRDERRASCQATYVRHEQSEQLFSLQAVCLDRRQRLFTALAAQLITADAGTVERGAELLAGLPAVAACRDGEALLLGVQPPADPALAAQVAAVQAQLAAARMQRLSGHRTEALQLATTQLARSAALPYPPLRAEALAELGLLGRDGGAPAELAVAEQRLLEAVDLAERYRDDELVSALWSELVLLARRHHAELTLAHQWARRALATSWRLSDGGRQRSLALSLLGSLSFREGALPLAEGLQRDALALAQQSGAPPVAMANRWHALANTLQRMPGRTAEARAAYQRAFALLRAELGDGHPRATRLLYDFGAFLESTGDIEAARALLTQALTTWTRSYGPVSLDAADTHLALGNLEINAGAIDSAAAHATRCAEQYAQLLPPESPQLIKLHTLVALVAFRQQRFPAALAAFERALQLAERVAPTDLLQLANLQSSVGETLTALGHHDRALALFTFAEQTLARLGTAPPIHTAMPLKGRGLALLAKGDRRGAIAALERALTTVQDQHAYPLEQADIQWALARALRGPNQPPSPRALTLARSALRLYEASGAAGKPHRDELERWLPR